MKIFRLPAREMWVVMVTCASALPDLLPVFRCCATFTFTKISWVWTAYENFCVWILWIAFASCDRSCITVRVTVIRDLSVCYIHPAVSLWKRERQKLSDGYPECWWSDKPTVHVLPGIGETRHCSGTNVQAWIILLSATFFWPHLKKVVQVVPKLGDCHNMWWCLASRVNCWAMFHFITRGIPVVNMFLTGIVLRRLSVHPCQFLSWIRTGCPGWTGAMKMLMISGKPEQSQAQVIRREWREREPSAIKTKQLSGDGLKAVGLGCIPFFFTRIPMIGNGAVPIWTRIPCRCSMIPYGSTSIGPVSPLLSPFWGTLLYRSLR